MKTLSHLYNITTETSKKSIIYSINYILFIIFSKTLINGLTWNSLLLFLRKKEAGTIVPYLQKRVLVK